MSSKLSATMARSLTNLGETPVGDWLNALNARKIHALSTYALSARGLIERVNIPCDPAGCACRGASTTDPGHAAPHYRITDAGREALKAITEAPAPSPAPKTPRPAPVAKPAPKTLTAPARKLLSAIAAGQVTGTYATSYPVTYDAVAPSPVEGLHLGSFDWTEPASDAYPFTRHHVATAAVARLIGYGYATVPAGEVETTDRGTRFMTGAPVVITDAGREALGLAPAEAPELAPEPAEVAPAAPAPELAADAVPGIHVTGISSPANLRRGDTVAMLAEDGESVAWTLVTTPRVTGDRRGFRFIGEAVCDEYGWPRNDRRVLELNAYSNVELVRAVPDYRTGATGRGVRDMVRADIADVVAAPTSPLVYLTDLKHESLNGLVWRIERWTKSGAETAPDVSLHLVSVCDRNGILVERRWLDYGGPSGQMPVITCHVNE